MGAPGAEEEAGRGWVLQIEARGRGSTVRGWVYIRGSGFFF